MKLRLKILLLAVVPLLAAAAAITVVVAMQALELAKREKQVVEDAWLASKESELRHYVRLAHSAILPLLAQAPDARQSPQTRERALQLLQQLEFGHDGYFFVYDMQGVNLMHPRQPELVGRNLWELRDTRGQAVIQNLLAAARRGSSEGQAVRYQWEKPSTNQTVEKLGYVMVIESWGWMLGTGIYLDDVEATLAHIDAAAQANIWQMIHWVGSIAGVSILLVALCGLALNISDHRQSDAQLRQLALKVVRGQEDERARLSRELHDGLSQLMVSIKLLLEVSRERLNQAWPVQAQGRETVEAPLDGALARLNDALGEVRRISHNLRPTLLDDLGLPAALTHLANEVSAPEQANAPTVSVRVEGHETPLPEAHATALFRFAQEALTNVMRHAGAQRVTLRLRYRPASIELTVADDGTGFDLQAVREDPRRGIGLRNMRERIESLGGQMRIGSDALGTAVQASLPLQAHAAVPAQPQEIT